MRWLALLALAVVGCMADDEMPCTIHHDGRYYDLNPLKASKDYEFQTPGNHLFAMNVCRRPVRETFGLKDVNDAEIGGFVRRDHGDFSIGALNTTLSFQDSNPRITLMNGSRCKSKSGDNQIRASTVIEFVCDTAVFSSGVPRLVAQLPPGDDEEACAFFIEWRTHVACPTNEPGGAWGFFTFLAFTIISLALLYLVAGTLYNRFVLRLRGIDQIPKFSIEGMKYHASEAFDWIKDLTNGARGHGGGYDRMPNDNLNAPFSGGGSFPRSAASTGGINPISHQTQVSGVPSEGGGGFVRPHPSRSTSGGMGAGAAATRRAEINPVSHQAQASAQLEPSQPVADHGPLPPAPPLVPVKDKHRPKAFDLESTMQEREFMLGDDEEEDDVSSARPTAAPPRASAEAITRATDGTPASEDAAVLRGRDMGTEGVTRL
ncbi:hypothetical protein D9615_000918 [Tricholomella constricta]|uniref:Autophagy-related protein 27 n=1 Tax=Tricholomella constricta TaxID=117010 RepID=A0A8H5M901_9AGAR|nr:hypothetical protein D9615_000918 [Tricholomella constricta]